ncbi:sigma-54-dependent Fis family transcriptional regulator [uncultured Microbulbifer sp.]|uniref:sigma-54 interaction domain-containing protein n=1 Tax=uncultured Microbulbifer sp. TaxID=348147 RepID=UPI0026370ADF|nr:sigma-54 dependent transcriptional regulator [uncultured Microbulbifer sp.]
MSRSRVFLRIKDSVIRERVLDELVSSLSVDDLSDDEGWLESLLTRSYEFAVVDTAGCSSDTLQPLAQSPVLAECEYLFLSDGTPNESLDAATSRSGGFHFRQPYTAEDICEAVVEVAAELDVEQETKDVPVSSQLDQYGLLVGSSRPMRKLYRTLRKVAASDANVLVVGESGVGKELVANTLHQASDRALAPFVAVNCGALSPELVESELFGHVKGAFTGAHKSHEGLFAQAEGGTLFLDEVTEMSLEHQVKLLRVLETGEYRPLGASQLRTTNVRIVSATNREPEVAVSDGIFREDLYFRLAQFPVRVPPLRDREGDIVGLAQHFLVYRNSEEGASKALSAAAVKQLQSHPWPGNVRELKYCVERAFILAESVIEPQHIILGEVETGVSEGSAMSGVPAGIPLDVLEQAAIEGTLEQNDGNKTETAEQLGISVKTLYNKLDKYEKAATEEGDLSEADTASK